jgi:hypothetical protein
MAEDKGYGSGKPRSAANSRARQRVAAKRYSKGKKNPEFNLVSIKKDLKKRSWDPTGFAGVGVGTMARAATSLLKAGSKVASRGVLERASAKVQGGIVGKLYAQQKASTPAGARGPKLTDKFYADQIKTGQYLKARSAVNMAKSRAPKLPVKRGR